MAWFQNLRSQGHGRGASGGLSSKTRRCRLRQSPSAYSLSYARRLRLECLEDRRLLSIDGAVDDQDQVIHPLAVDPFGAEDSAPSMAPGFCSDALAITLLSSSGDGIRGRLSVPHPVWNAISGAGTSFVHLGIPGWGHTSDVGRPELPVFRTSFSIPENVTVVASCVELASASLGSGYLVYPVQPPAPDLAFPDGTYAPTEFAWDQLFYSSGVSVETDVLTVGALVSAGDRRSVSLEFSPFRYDLSDGELQVVTDLEFNLAFQESDAPLQPEPPAPDLAPSAAAADYLVITADAFYEEVLPLAQWKHKEGFKTYVAKMSAVGTTYTQVYNYIRNAYDADPNKPKYVLLVGDQENVPSYDVVGHPYHGSTHPWHTDYDYAKLAGTDNVADLAVGRLPGDTEAQITNMVNRILAYERTPDMGAWYDDVLIAGLFQDSNDYNWVADRWFMEDLHRASDFLGGDYDFWTNPDPYNKGFTIHTNRVWDSSTSSTLHYRSDGYPGRIAPPDPVPDAWKFKTDESISTTINAGTSLVLHRDHGYSGGSGWADPNFVTSNVNALANGNKMPVVLSLNCETGRFDDMDAFAEAWMRNPNGGAVAFTGAMRTSYSGHNDSLHVGIFDAMWNDYDTAWQSVNYANSWRFGDLMNYGKDRVFSGYGYSETYAVLTARMFNVFGDPAMLVRTATPAALHVTHPASVAMGAAANVTVSVDIAGAPVSGAMVCISRGDSADYWVGTTNAAGQVTFSGLTASENGDYDVVVTALNATSYQATITSIAAGPYASLVAPPNGSATNTDRGYVDILWTDHSGLGLNMATINASDITIPGVVVGAPVPQGGSIWRYPYTGSLAQGTVQVTVVAGQVQDNAGDWNVGLAQSFQYDQAAPAASLSYPAPGSTLFDNPGYVDVLWSDGTGAGIDPSTLGAADITITGVTVSGAPTQQAGGVWRYPYAGSLPQGTIRVGYVAGQVLDLAGNPNPAGSDTFTRQPLHPPFTETWETGTMAGYWQAIPGAEGRIQVTSANGPYAGAYHITLDDKTDGTAYSLNQLILHIDLAGYKNVTLSFANREWSDEDNPEDVVQISVNGGSTWHNIVALTGTNSTSTYTLRGPYNLDALGLTYSSDTLIRFQQYDDFAITTDGMAFDNITVAGVPSSLGQFTVTLPAAAREGDGTLVGQGRVTVSQAPSSDLAVNLVSGDTSEITVPASVTIPAGQTWITFDPTIVDDDFLDGTQQPTVTASATSYDSGQTSLLVHDNETATLSVSLPATAAEGMGTLTGAGTITVSQAPAVDITVALTSSDTSEITVLAGMTIPAGQTSASFDVTIVNDNQIDGPQIATVTAHVAGWTDGSDEITLLDNENYSLVVSLPSRLYENQGLRAGAGSVSISGTLPADLAIDLSSSDLTELAVPVSVTIPAGQTSTAFDLSLIDDGEQDGIQMVTVAASAAGFVDGSRTMEVADDEWHHFAMSSVSSPQLAGVPFSMTIAAKDIHDATIAVYTSTVNLRAAGDHGPAPITPATTTPFSNGTWTGNVTVNALDTGVVLVAEDGAGHTGSSNAFQVTYGPLDHFQWSTVASPQQAGVAFPVTLTAQDAHGYTVDSFNGQAALFATDADSTVTIGGGTGTWIFPMATSYHDARTQVIYLANEIGTAGAPRTISALDLYVSTVPGLVMNNWTIRMKHTLLSSYSTYAWEGPSSGWTTVYQANQAVSAIGWVRFVFATPFVYDGTSNLMVDYSFNNSGSSSSAACRGTLASGVRSVCYQTNSMYGDPLSWSGTSSPSPTGASSVPNIRLVAGASVPILPATTGLFAGGVWTGDAALPFAAKNVLLRADDGGGHFGRSNNFCVLAQSSNLLVNGDFETGTFAGWTATANRTPEQQLTPWTVGPRGGGFFFNSQPRGGLWSAYNGFDGASGLQYELYQDVTIPTTGDVWLLTHHRIVWQGNGTATQPRTFTISVRDTAGQLRQTLHTQTIILNSLQPTDLGWSENVFDVSAYAGQTVRIHFAESIPENNTGPALLELDDLGLFNNPRGIRGTKFHDLDANGTRDAGEPGLAGWTIFLDADGDGVLDPAETSTLTGPDGSYAFYGLPAGTYTVAEVLPHGWKQTFPALPGNHRVTVAPARVTENVDFGNDRISEIRGTTWEDLDGDGARSAGEPGRSGWTVFLDDDNDGTLDPGEKSTRTGSDGGYVFAMLPPGTYTVRQVQQPGWIQTAPAGEAYTLTLTADELIEGNDFGNRGGANAELLVNGGFETGDFTGWTAFASLPPAQQLTPWTVGAAGGGFFFNSQPHGGAYSAYNGFDGDVGLRYTLSQDVPIPAGGKARLLTHHRIVYQGTGLATQARTFTISVRDMADQVLRTLYTQTILPSALVQTDLGWKAMVFDVSAYAGQTVRIHFAEQISEPFAAPGLLELDDISLLANHDRASITGVKWNDLDADGVRDTGEPGLAGWTIYADANGDGQLDPGERSAVTDKDGVYLLADLAAGQHVVAEAPQAGWLQRYPAAGTHTIDLVPGEIRQNIHFGNHWNVLPTVTGTLPSLAGGTITPGATSLQVVFSESVTGAGAAANYELRSLGADALLGTADDTIVPLSVSYSGTTATLGFAALPESVYRLTVNDAIGDAVGNPLDGDGNGTPGGDWVREFVVDEGALELVGPGGAVFDIDLQSHGAGQLLQGTANAFDGLNRLQVGAIDYAPPLPAPGLVNDGRTVLTASQTLAGLTVSREITVPNTGSEDFARTIDVFTNTTGSPITTTVRIVGNLGSDDATTVWATSDGDTLVETTDQWIGTDDADGSGNPAIIHYIHGPRGLTPTMVGLVGDRGDNIEWTYDLTVPTGQTVRLAHFTILGNTRAEAEAAAAALVGDLGFGGQAAAFLTAPELASIANYYFSPVEPPAVTTLDDAPDPLRQDQSLTLTATASDPDGTVVAVRFYRESNSQPGLQTGLGGDTLVGSDNNPADGWTATTAVWTLPAATYTYYAQAEDETGTRSPDGVAAVSTTNTVSAAANLELLVNGGFETGDFTGWTAYASLPPAQQLTPWTVGPAGGGFFFNSQPHGGAYSAYNGFDGTAGLQYTLHQDVAIPAGGLVQLVTHHRIVYQGNTVATQPRTFAISVRNTAGQVLETLYTQTILPDQLAMRDLGWQTQIFNLSAYAGQMVRLHFAETVPQSFAGPAMLELDDLSLLSNVQPVTITGVKFNDLDADGARDPGEPGLEGWSIYLTSGGAQVGQAITDVNGVYTFSNVAPGTYTIAEEVRAGWVQTVPAGTYVVTAGSGQLIPDKDFGNHRPTAEAGGPYNASEGVVIILDASGSGDPAGHALSYVWDLDNDGQYDDATGPAPSFTPPDNGTYSLGLKVTDALGAWHTDTASVTTVNLPPAIAGVADTGPVLRTFPVTVTITASDPAGARDPLTYEFDFDNDGTYEVSGSLSSAQHTYAVAGIYPVTVRVSDDDGGVATSNTSVTVNDDVTPPAVDGTVPGLVAGLLAPGATSIAVRFSEAVAGADTAANYELRGLGPDWLLGTADDAVVLLSAAYAGTTATLGFAALPESVYRLTVKDTVTDLLGNRLDGDADGAAGGDWVREFVLVPSGGLFYSTPGYSSGGGSPVSVAVGDLNGDGRADLAVANAGSNALGVLLGQASGAFAPAATYASGGVAPYCVAIGDLNGDGRADLAVANQADSTIGVVLGQADGAFAPAATYASGGDTPYCVAMGDIDGDGRGDLAVANANSNNVSVLVTQSDGTLAPAVTYPCGGSFPCALAIGDFNLDGRADLAVANANSNNVGVLLGQSGDTFAPAVLYSCGGNSPRSLAVGDINGDGRADLAVANQASNKAGVLLGQPGGAFAPAANYSSGGNSPCAVAIVDVNGDERADLALANRDSDNVGILLGRAGGAFASAVTYSCGGSSPRSVAVGDLNGDGRVDLAVANAYSASVHVLPNGLAVALCSPHAMPFDIQPRGSMAGQLVQGTRNAFDGLNRLQIGANDYAPPSQYPDLQDGMRTLVLPPQTLAGLSVSREITVPSTGNEDFARTIDVFANPTGSPITATVRIAGNLGSDGATTVWATSNGDALVEPTDQWIGTDDGDGTGAPAIIHYIHGPVGLEPTMVRLVGDRGDNIEWTYDLTVPPGQTVRLAHFTILADTRSEAATAATALVADDFFGAQAAVFLTQDELTSLANFQFPMDFGDAPDPAYPTLAASNGARHAVLPGAPLLGMAIDGETDGQPNAIATGDDEAGSADDEDGIAFTSPLVAGDTATLDVDMTASPARGLFSAWIDFNADGDWSDPSEQIFADAALAAGSIYPLSFAVPVDAAAGNTFARFRISTAAGLAPSGPAPDGEVEDYQIQITAQQPEILVGQHTLVADTAGQQILIYVHGGRPVEGLDFFVRLGDGLAPVPSPAPIITAVDLVGTDQQPTIFFANNDGQIELGSGPYWHGAMTTTSDGSVAAEGPLAVITLDTTGVTEGTWDLVLCDPGDVETSFGTVAAAITHGQILVNDRPRAQDDSYSLPEDGSLDVAVPGVLGNDTDPHSELLTAELVEGSGPLHAASFAFQADGSFTYVPQADYHGTDTFTYRAFDGNAYSDPATVTLLVTPVADLRGRHIFYNNSSFDGNSPDANADDDNAIAPPPGIAGHGHAGLPAPKDDEPWKELGKQALLPGQRASFVNYTSYAKGINGIMIDVDDLGNPQGLGPEDFEFHVCRDPNRESWQVPAVAPGISVRQKDVGGEVVDRVTLVWPDNTIRRQWLRVTVKATSDTGLTEPDVFYFGNAIGETGDRFGAGSPNAYVNATDVLGIRHHPHSYSNPSAIEDPYDFDRNGRVNLADISMAKQNATGYGTAIGLFTAPLTDQAAAALAHDLVLADLAEGQGTGKASLPVQAAWLYDLGGSTSTSRVKRPVTSVRAWHEVLAAYVP